MGATRIQVVVDLAERELFRARAESEGLSLSAWMREAARQRLTQSEAPSPDWLWAFFSQCDSCYAPHDRELEVDEIRELLAQRYTGPMPP